MEILVFVVIGGLVISFMLLYLFLMLFYPEWVGITGKKTKQELAAEAERRKERANQEQTKGRSEFM